ncbi:phage tail tape measure protein [Enterococcus sp. JM9B]|nr:phage tail tape measure protein [Enterococcus sp. JM9B]KAF1303664.1 phage tail tape measure protein [Enterococcus sp. JM9B]
MGAAGTPLGNMVIKLGLDDADFGRGVANAKKQTKYFANEMKANMKIADLAGNQLGKLGARYDGLTKIIGAQEKQVSSLKKAYDESFVDGKATDSTKRLAAQLQDANGKLANYKKQLIDTAGAYAEFKVKNEGFTGAIYSGSQKLIKAGDNISAFGKGVSNVGSQLTSKVSLPIAAGFVVATKKAADFTTQIGEIGPLLTNGGKVTAEYKKQLDQMGDSSKKWSKDYGVSTTEINNGLAEIVRKGYDANQTMGVMPSILDATKASGEQFNDVMNVTTEVISQFNLKGKTYSETLQNTARVTDSLTYVANATSAGFTDLGLAMGYVGPVANSLGMSVEETASAVGLLSDAGIGGEKAGTALRGALTRLLKPSKQNKDGFKQLGVSVEDFKNGSLTMPDILDKIKNNTEGWTDAQRTAAIALAFGTESQSAMNVLVGQGGDALRNLTNETKGASGATKDIAKSMNDLPANKVARFKESLNVLAITLGEKLLPIVTPWIDKATDMVNKFSELDDATQQNIIKWGLLAAAAGPTLRLLGSGISVFGGVTKGIGMTGRATIDLIAAFSKRQAIKQTTAALAEGGAEAVISGGKFSTLKSIFTKTGSAATVAAGTGGTSGVSALVTGLGAVAGPALIAVGAVAGVATALYIGKKAYDEHQLAGEKWGTKVTEEQDKVITKSYEMSEKASGYVADYANGVTDAADKAIKANKDIVDSIQKVLDKELERKKKAAEKIEDKGQKEQAEKYLDWQEEVNKAEVQQAQKKVDRINAILKSASENNRTLSTQERQFIANNYKMLNDDQLKAAGFSKEKRLAIETAYQVNLKKLSAKELGERRNSIETALNKERASYEEQAASLKEIYKDNPVALKESMDKLNTEYQSSTETMVTALAKTLEASGYSIEEYADVWKQYGYTTEEVQRMVNYSAEKTSQNLDMLAKGTSEADAQWNALALDPKTGEVRTNMADTLVDIAKTDEGWQQLQFLAKNAKISTNAKEEIAIAMGEAGKWDELYLTDKQLLVNSNPAMLALYDSIEELGLWNEYNADRKTLGVNSADAIYQTMQAHGALGTWNKLSPELKELIAKGPAKMSTDEASKALREFNKLDPKKKKLLSDNTNAVRNFNYAKDRLNSYNNIKPGVKRLHAVDETYNGVQSAKNSINSIPNNTYKNIWVQTHLNNEYEKTMNNRGIYAAGLAKGTNYHKGGLALVNDQRGPLYKELVQLPSGESFIPQSRNVMLDLPKGSKVLRAALTKKLMPNYADGVGIPENSKWVQNLRSIDTDSNANNNKVIVQNNNSGLENKLDVMISLLDKLVKKPNVLKAILDADEVSAVTDKHLGKNFTKLSYTRGNV